MNRFITGQMVHYCPIVGNPENGIVKSFSGHNPNIAFVVYHCNDDWDNYRNYTGESTRLEDLRDGWVKQ